MIIEKLYGFQSTNITLSDRFTVLLSAAQEITVQKPRRRSMTGYVGYQNNQNNFRNINQMDLIDRSVQIQNRRRMLRQRLGVPFGTLRRANSESNLPGLRRSNSFGNLTNQSIKNRLSFNGNMRRSASFTNLSGGARRARFRRRGQGPQGPQRRQRGNFRGARQGQGRIARPAPNPLFRNTRSARGWTSRGRGRGRGGNNSNQTPKPVPTKEELDEQLDQYMASSKSALDKELDAYMRTADGESWD